MARIIEFYIGTNVAVGAMISLYQASGLLRKTTPMKTIKFWMKFAEIQWWADCLMAILLLSHLFNLGIQKNALTIQFIFPAKILINTVNKTIFYTEVDARKDTEEYETIP